MLPGMKTVHVIPALLPVPLLAYAGLALAVGT
jgi:hypothetical protein